MLLENRVSLTAVEIKSAETLAEDFFKGLGYFKKLSGIPPEQCVLIYGGDKNYTRTAGRVLGWRHMTHLFT
ncbi:MAG: hypothetical protein SWC96_01120 [Thermodesulfobacteriota bacterium]|nr:hypothetical protein [Thermodesulfobacteriota bacterium]